MDLTAETLEGFNAGSNVCPYIRSSDSWLAWTIGRLLGNTGHSAPTKVRRDRVHTLNVGDMAFACRFTKDGNYFIERMK